MVEDTAGAFTFVDLFAGIGGFHAALESLGGRCVYAAEKDTYAAQVYLKAWPKDDGDGFRFVEDINEDVQPLDEGTTIEELARLYDDKDGTIPNVPHDFDVLAAGFPCQAFSKSGHQRGVLDETRGTLFYNVLRIVAERKPKIVFLENVRNLVGPRHRDTTFKTIVETLRGLEYVVSPEPTIISPHRIPPEMGGGPQVRERVYILAIRQDLVAPGTPFEGFSYPGYWNPKHPQTGWKIAETPLTLDDAPAAITDEWLEGVPNEHRAARFRDLRGLDSARHSVRDAEWLRAWEALLRAVVDKRNLKTGSGTPPFPGFPIWFAAADESWLARERVDAHNRNLAWKNDFLDKSLKFLKDYDAEIRAAHVLDSILGFGNNSWRKLEWQAGDATSLAECLIQLRPSGVRIKRASYTPALVAINQTPILGAEKRRLTPYEAGRLQLFPDHVYEAMLSLGQPEREMYKQFGNAVHVGAVVYGLTQFLHHHFKCEEPREARILDLWNNCKKSAAWRSVEPTAPL